MPRLTCRRLQWRGVYHRFATFSRDDSGPTFAEYGLMVIVIALVVVSAASGFGEFVLGLFQSAAAAP